MNIQRSRAAIATALIVAVIAGVCLAPFGATAQRAGAAPVLPTPEEVTRRAPGSEQVSAWLLQGYAGVTVDAFIDGQQVGADLAPGDAISIPLWSRSTGRRLEIRRSDDGRAIFASSLDLLVSGDYSLILLAPASGVGAPRLVLFPNDLPEPPSASAGWLSVRNVDLADAVDLRINGVTVATDIGRAGGVLVPASGWVDVSVVAGGTVIALGPVLVLPGRATVGHLVRHERGSEIWQTLLTPSSQPAQAETCNGHRVSVVLSAGHTPTEGTDVILGTDSDDTILAGAGDDIVCARAGNDYVRGQDGNDTIFGGSGDDTVRGADDNDYIDGGPGVDDLNGGRGDDVVLGGDGNDLAVRGGTDDDYVDGGPGDDRIINGNGGSDIVVGGAGNDRYMAGGPRSDQLFGGLGDDVLKGLGGPDIIFGGPGDDVLYGGKLNDRLLGGAGTDSCRGGSGSADAVQCDTFFPETSETAWDEPTAELAPASCASDEGFPAGVTIECFTLTVPADYYQPSSGSTMTLAIRRASRGTGAVPLLILDGDLQALDTPFSGGLKGWLADPTRPFDFVMVDLRGTGASTPSLACPEVDEIAIPAKSVTYRSALLSTAQEEAACAARLKKAGIDFGQFNAATNAQDLDLARRSLAISRWDIWAAGPGTMVAQALTHHDPDAVGKVVLQSGLGFRDDLIGAAVANTEGAFVALEQACQNDSGCRQSFPTLGDDRRALYADLNDERPVVDAVDDGQVFPILVDGDRFMREILRNIIQRDGGPAYVFEAIDIARVQLPVVTQAGESVPSIGTVKSVGASLANLCQDQYVLERSVKARCEPWVSPDQIWTDPTDLVWPVPTLIIAGAFDPITPPGWAKRLANTSDLAVAVEFSLAGTGLVSNRCAQDLVANHLAGLPLDVTCRVDGTGLGS